MITKIKEADEYISSILGIDREQFTRIVMLAQGDFQKLLFADTTSRQEIFRKLFNTEKYQVFQKRLKDKTVKLYSDYNECRIRLDQQISEITVPEDMKEKEEALNSGDLSIPEVLTLISELQAADEEKVAELEKLTKSWPKYLLSLSRSRLRKKSGKIWKQKRKRLKRCLFHTKNMKRL